MTRRTTTLALVASALTALAAPVPGAGAAASTSAARESAVTWAMGQVGTREVGTSNCSPKITAWERDMGLQAPPCRPWCGAYVHQAFLQAGVRLSSRLIDPHRSYLDAVAGVRGLKRIAPSQVRRGDLVFYKFRQRVLASHVAIARDRPRNGRLDTVEGNVSHASSLQTRSVKFVVLAARVVDAG